MSYIDPNTFDEWISRDPRDFDPADEAEPELTAEDLEELEQREFELAIEEELRDPEITIVLPGDYDLPDEAA